MKQSTLSRRTFLATAAAAGVAGAVWPIGSYALEYQNPEVDALVASSMGIDAHNHADVPLTAAEVPGPAIDLSAELKRSGLSAICMTFAVDYQKINDPDVGYERFVNGLSAMDQQLKNNGMKRALNFADLKEAFKKKQPIVIQSVEGGHFLDGKLGRLTEAHNRGLRHLGLLHDNDASVPLGDIYTKEAQFGGLTPFGTEVVRECNRLGILIDLTHASPDTVAAALKSSSKPMMFSHTSLNTQLGNNADMARMMKPRLISKEQAKVMADAGTVIGIWKHLTNSPQDYVRNIRAMVDVVGVDHVCLGTDSKLTPPYRPGGEDKNERRVGERTNDIWENQNVGFYYAVVGEMLKAGFTATEISKIGGGNFARVFEKATTG